MEFAAVILLILFGAGAIVYSIYRTPDDQLQSDETRAIKRWVSSLLKN